MFWIDRLYLNLPSTGRILIIMSKEVTCFRMTTKTLIVSTHKKKINILFSDLLWEDLGKRKIIIITNFWCFLVKANHALILLMNILRVKEFFRSLLFPWKNNLIFSRTNSFQDKIKCHNFQLYRPCIFEYVVTKGRS